jgi:hypothetical protein
MRYRRLIANFFLKGCALGRLHNTSAQRLIRAILDEIDLQHVRNTNACRSFTDRDEMNHYVNESCVNGEAMDYLEFGVFQGNSIRGWTNLNRHHDSRF